MNLIDLKERVALCSLFRPEERSFILDAINSSPQWHEHEGTLLHDPGNYMGRLDHIWAYLSIDAGGEGICGINNMPMVAADKRIIDKLRAHARMVAKHSGKVIRLAKFTKREDVEIIRP
jgi:hypothetical protein